MSPRRAGAAQERCLTPVARSRTVHYGVVVHRRAPTPRVGGAGGDRGAPPARRHGETSPGAPGAIHDNRPRSHDPPSAISQSPACGRCMSHRGAGPRRSRRLPIGVGEGPVVPPTSAGKQRRRRARAGAAAIGVLWESSPARPGDREPAPLEQLRLTVTAPLAPGEDPQARQLTVTAPLPRTREDPARAWRRRPPLL